MFYPRRRHFVPQIGSVSAIPSEPDQSGVNDVERRVSVEMENLEDTTEDNEEQKSHDLSQERVQNVASNTEKHENQDKDSSGGVGVSENTISTARLESKIDSRLSCEVDGLPTSVSEEDENFVTIAARLETKIDGRVSCEDDRLAPGVSEEDETEKNTKSSSLEVKQEDVQVELPTARREEEQPMTLREKAVFLWSALLLSFLGPLFVTYLNIYSLNQVKRRANSK